jgi:hypothetical protein
MSSLVFWLFHFETVAKHFTEIVDSLLDSEIKMQEMPGFFFKLTFNRQKLCSWCRTSHFDRCMYFRMDKLI